jgi:hypothetical protein
LSFASIPDAQVIVREKLFSILYQMNSESAYQSWILIITMLLKAAWRNAGSSWFSVERSSA